LISIVYCAFRACVYRPCFIAEEKCKNSYWIRLYRGLNWEWWIVSLVLKSRLDGLCPLYRNSMFVFYCL
jgi:hypothetical protein